MKLVAFTALALAGFAANSLPCRAALRDGAIGAAAFTTIRLGSGALVLAVLVALRGRSLRGLLGAGSWSGAALLLAYAWAFAAAYHGLTAGLHALLLFAAVQATLFGLALRSGRRPGGREWAGLAVAFAGLAVLLGPGVLPGPGGLAQAEGAAPLLAAALMLAAGAAWGGYTWLGAGASRPRLRGALYSDSRSLMTSGGASSSAVRTADSGTQALSSGHWVTRRYQPGARSAIR